MTDYAWKSNRDGRLHAYVWGNTFNNIFGGATECAFGSISKGTATAYDGEGGTKIVPRWSVHDHAHCLTDGLDTLEEAVAFAKETWPQGYLKTPQDFRNEDDGVSDIRKQIIEAKLKSNNGFDSTEKNI